MVVRDPSQIGSDLRARDAPSEIGDEDQINNRWVFGPISRYMCRALAIWKPDPKTEVVGSFEKLLGGPVMVQDLRVPLLRMAIKIASHVIHLG